MPTNRPKDVLFGTRVFRLRLSRPREAGERGLAFRQWVDSLRTTVATPREEHRRLLRALLLLGGVLFGLHWQPGLARSHPAELERITILTQRIEAQPQAPHLYIDRASAYSHGGKYALAMADLKQAAQLGDPVLAAYELGLLYFRLGELDRAKDELDRYLERFPNHARALEKRARLFAARGDEAAAAADYERFFVVVPRPNPGSFLSAAKLFAEEEDSAIALRMLDRGIQRLGVIPQLQQYAIELELRDDHVDRAVARLETLEPALGDGPDWHVQMAELLIRVDRRSLARQHLSNAKETLGEMRATPARTRLGSRIEALESKLDAAQ